MPDTEPFAIRFLEALATYLSTEVQEGSEYFNTIGPGAVFIGRPEFDDNDPSTMLSILEVPIPDPQMRTPEWAPVTAGPWEIFIQGFTRQDPDRSATFRLKPAYRLQNDIRVALLKLKPARGAAGREPVLGFPEVDGLDLQRGVVRPHEQYSDLCYFWTPLTIHLVNA